MVIQMPTKLDRFNYLMLASKNARALNTKLSNNDIRELTEMIIRNRVPPKF